MAEVITNIKQDGNPDSVKSSVNTIPHIKHQVRYVRSLLNGVVLAIANNKFAVLESTAVLYLMYDCLFIKSYY